jgi:hypothetical protein
MHQIVREGMAFEQAVYADVNSARATTLDVDVIALDASNAGLSTDHLVPRSAR